MSKDKEATAQGQATSSTPEIESGPIDRALRGEPDKPKRRTRGPNKTKKPEVAITVRTEASVTQSEIIKLLTAYVGKMLDPETAAGMELQVHWEGKEWTPVPANDKAFPRVRFATKGMR